MLHVSRARSGARRLSEIAVLRRGPDGGVGVLTAWHADSGAGAGAGCLAELLRSRGRVGSRTAVGEPA